MYEMPHRFGPADANGRVFSPVQHRMVKLTPAMVKAVEILDRFGYVSVGGGVKVATAVALMDRGILREAKSHGSRHYPATTREQVHGAAIIEHGLRICDKIDAEEAAGVDTWVDPEDGDGPMFIGAASGALVNPGAAPAHVEADPLPWHAQAIKDALVNPGAAPEACPVHGGRSHRACESYPAPCTPVEYGPIDKAAILRRRPNIDSFMDSGVTSEPQQSTDITGARCLNAEPHEGHRIVGSFRGSCPGITVPQCPNGHAGVPVTDGGTCAECEQPIAPAETCTDVSNVQASITDEVAELRTEIQSLWSLTGYANRATMMARLDRIAALVPQRATDNGVPLWQTPNGGIVAEPTAARPTWRALYTVAGR